MAIEGKPLPFQGLSDHDGFQLEPQFAANVRNVRSLRDRIVRSPGGTQLAPTPVPYGGVNAGSGTYVGTFVKATGTGHQTITHSLMATPGAMILFCEGPTAAATVTANVASSRGFTDGTNSECITTVEDGGTYGRRIVDSLSAFIRAADGAVVASAAFVSWSSTTVVINWTVNDGVAREMSYILIGGGSVASKVKRWAGTLSSGNQAVTGIGFKPQLVFHIALGANNSATAFAAKNQNIGAMDDMGHQWAVASNTGEGLGITASWSTIRTDSCILDLGQDNALVVASRWTYVSMDADGFTVNQITAGNTAVISLCLHGLVNVQVGNFTRTTASAPVNQSVTGVGFQPQGVLLCSPGAMNGASGSVSLGAADGINQAYVNYVSTTDEHTVKSLVRTDAVLGDITNPPAVGTENARASLTTLDSGGFSLNYTLTNTNALVCGYIAFLAVTSSQAGQVGIPRNYPEVYVDPSGPATQRYVLLTHKSAFVYAAATSSTGVFNPTAEAYTGNQYKRFSIANTQGVAAWSQGVDNIREWDGTSFSALVTSGQDHAARALLAFADRIVSVRPYFGGADHPTQIRWCINGNVNDWNGTGSGVLEIIETSQDPLVTGFVLGDRAFLAKRRELIELIWTGTLSPVFGTLPRVRGMGVLAPHSVGLAEQVAFWLGPDDIYMFDGSTLTPVGERVYNTITSLIDYQNLDQIQGAVYTPDSQYHLVVPPYKFIYDYRRDIWDWDDVQDFQAIGVYTVGDGTNFTADIDKSEFIVVGDSLAQTTRVDFQATSWLGAPIDSYFETRDFTADDIGTKGGALGRFSVSLWDMNSLREIRFQGPPGNGVEVGISLDRGASWQTTSVTINQFGVGVAWFQVAFSMIRFRFRDYGTDSYEIRGSWGFDVEQAGYNIG